MTAMRVACGNRHSRGGCGPANPTGGLCFADHAATVGDRGGKAAAPAMEAR
jgi:hypothetical protein